MIHDYLKPLMHYVCVGLLIVLTYFLGASLLQHTPKYSGPVGTVAQPTAAPAAQAAQIIANAMKDQALAEALHGQNVALSAAQQTVANAVSSYSGVNARMAGALAAGLTKPAPKAEVITVATTAGAKFSPSPAPDDDAIKADMKEVLATTPLNVKTQSDVKVSWEDVPFSPISAVYTSDGASGAAYTLHKAPALSFNVLGLVNKGKLEPGLDFEHILKGTSAGIGVGATYNLGTHKVEPQATIHIHF